MRLQKIIAAAGLGSRRAAEEYIAQGRVAVNGVTATLGQSADAERDEITLDGKAIQLPESKLYIMLNKPRGVVTTMRDDRGRKTVAELVADVPARVFPVGRLDFDTEGLLVMTNDGDTANRLAHPSHEVMKTYHARVTGRGALTIDRELSNALPILRSELEIDGFVVKPATVRVLRALEGNALLQVTIGEGRNRQVRKMCELAGLRVIRLRRVSVGELKLGGLKSGTWRYLSVSEIDYLRGLESKSITRQS